MTKFETPLMRDVSKLLKPILVGIILAFILLFSLTPLNFMYYSLQWELEQLEKGFTWNDKKQNGCFEREGGITYYDRDLQREVTSTGSCSSSALPWELLIWSIPLLIGLMIGIIVLYKFNCKISKQIQNMKSTSQNNNIVRGNNESKH
jgi:hypothetical protein